MKYWGDEVGTNTPSQKKKKKKKVGTNTEKKKKNHSLIVLSTYLTLTFTHKFIIPSIRK